MKTRLRCCESDQPRRTSPPLQRKGLWVTLGLVMLALFSGLSLRASHFAGGDVTYRFISGNTYEVTLSLYRDCAGITFGSSQQIQISPAASGLTVVNLPLVSTTEITQLCPGQVSRCSGGSVPGREQVIFRTNITLPPLPGNAFYTLANNSNARNAAITTLSNPGSNSWYISATLNPSLTSRNSSPTFLNPPVAFVCANQPVTISPNASDADGDALQYSLVNCKQFVNTDVTYLPGFSGTVPLTTSTGVNLNTFTGLLSFTPTIAQVGVVCVQVAEFRAGVQIGTIVRDIQVIVNNCNNACPIVNNVVNQVVPVGQTFCTNISATDADGDLINLTKTGVGTFTVTSSGAGFTNGTFCFTPTISQAGQTFTITINAVDNACPQVCNVSTTFNITVPVPCSVTASATSTPATCGVSNGTATAIGTGFSNPISYSWSNGASGQTITGLAAGTYSVTIVGGSGCVASATTTVAQQGSNIVATTVVTHPTCPNSANGSITVGVTGGTAPYTYSLNGGAGQSSNVFSGLGAGVYQVVVTDAFGCASPVAIATLAAVDNVPPVISCPANISQNTDPGVCSAVVSYSVNASDNCSGTVSVVQTAGGASGTAFGIGTTTNSFTATDASGNTSSCSFTVTVADAQAPVITCPANISVNNTPGTCGAAVQFGVSATDNCPGVITAQTAGQASGSVFSIGTTSNTFTATDAAGNTASCSFTVTVTDNEAPTVTCPANISVNNDAGVCGAAVSFGAIASDNCPGVSTAQTAGPASGSIFSIGTTTNTFTATDASGNTASCSFTVTVTDNEAPTVTCPANISVNNDAGVCGAAVSFGAIASDNCPGVTTAQTAGPASGSVFSIGTTTNTFTATDASGNTASCSFTVTVTDNENPTIACPANISVNNDAGVCGAVVTYSVTSSDNCPGSTQTQTAGAASGSTFSVGTTTNSFTVTDAAGNTASCSFTVTVSENENPTITCPANISVNNDAGVCSAVVQYGVSASDNCTGVTTAQTGGLASGSAFPVGTTTNSYTATDAYGNTASCSFTVTVADNEAPVAVCQNVTVALDANGNGSITANQVDNGSTDNCGIASISIDNSNFNCNNIAGGSSGATDLFFSEYVEGSSNNKYIEIFNGTGAAVNLSDYALRLYANGSAIPTTVSTLSGFLADGAVVVFRNSSAAVYAGASTVLSSVNWNGDDAVELYNTVTGQAVDIFGNIGNDPGTAWTATGGLTTVNATLRRKSFVSGGITTNPGGTGPSAFTALGTEWDVFATDDVSGLGSHALSGGGNTVTLTVTDVNGNSSTCTSTVTVVDNIAPNAVCQDITVQLDANGDASIVASQIDNGSTDNCAIASLDVTPSSFNCSNVGGNTVTLTVTDVSGNASTCTATVTVEDNVAPVALCQDITVQLDNSGNAVIVASQIDNGSSDACGIASLGLSDTDFNCSDANPVNANGLFFSEYMEGLGNNKCLEIYNGTGAAVDLAAGGYQIRFYFNGLSTTGTIINLTGVIADGDVYVVCDNNAFNASQADQTSTANFYNGNDAIVLSNAGGVLDVIGRIGDNPGTEWSVGGNSTMDRTLVRAAYVFQGVTNPANGFPTLGNEWIEFPANTIVNLGSHNYAPNGGQSVVLTVTDVNGNSSACAAVVTVEDNVAPDAICQNITVQLDNAGNASIVASQIDGGSSDACGIESLVASQTAFDCSDVGVVSVTLTVTDVSGNVSTCAADVTVEDNVAPVALCQDVTVQLDANGNGSTTAQAVDNGSNDACGIASLTLTPSTFTCNEVGANTVVLTVTDVNGNVSSCTATAMVEDNVAPDALCQNVTVQLDANGNGSTTAQAVDNGSSDACGIASISLTPSTFTCNEVGANTVVLTVTDVNGNVSTCTATATVEDNVAPVALCQDVTVQLDANGAGSTTAQAVDNGSSDACGIASTVLSQTAFDCNNVGANTVTLTVTDVNGNASTCTATVTVEDNVAPDALCQNVTVTLDNAGNGSITANQVDNGSSDACGIATLSVDPSTFGCNELGANTVTLTVTDVNGNVSTCTAIVMVQEGAFAEIVCPSDITTNCETGNGGAFVTWNTPTAIAYTSCSEPCATVSCLPGFHSLGTYGGSQYFLSYGSNYTWAQANTAAQNAGGHLVVINTSGENNFLRQNLNCSYIWMGYTDLATEGTFRWVNGDPTTYTNWSPGEPNNGGGSCCYGSSGSDYAVFQSNNGSWYDRGGCDRYAFVVEISCPNTVVVTQIGGPAPGSLFPQGTTTVTYLATSNLGATDTCSFNVTVEERFEIVCPSDIVLACSQNNGGCGNNNHSNGNHYGGGSCGNGGNNGNYGGGNGNCGNNGGYGGYNGGNCNNNGWGGSCNGNHSGNCGNNGGGNNNPGGQNVSWSEPTVVFDNCSQNACPVNTCISGFTYLGEYNGHRYYYSQGCGYSWNQANAAAQAAGGYLASIGSAGENSFVTSNLNASYAWIGINDAASEGNFVWSNGEMVNYTNWQSGEPNNSGSGCCGYSGADYGVIRRSNGRWYDQGSCADYGFVMEIPCFGYTLVQTGGPASGSFFADGTSTTISYMAYTTAGDTVRCSFDVTLDDCPPVYCSSNGQNTNSEWIGNVTLTDVNNTSGNDGGYGNYTNLTSTLIAGSQATISLTPGYAGQNYREYWRVWIDWNRDGDFDDAQENAFQGNGYGTGSGTISVPSWASTRPIRMRVAMRWNCYPQGPCSSFYYGEVEDYTIQVTAGGLKTGEPGAGAEGSATVFVNETETEPTPGFEFTQLYPNPVVRVNARNVNVDFRSGNEEDVTLKLMDLNGRLVANKAIRAARGVNSTSLDVSQLPAGTYVLEVAGESAKTTEKLVIQ